MANSLFQNTSYVFRTLGGRDSRTWIDRAYILDWVIAIILHFLAIWIESLPVFERVFSPDDPTISFPHAEIQRVGGSLNDYVSILTSVGVAISLGTWRMSLFEIHQGVLVAFAARALSDTVTEALKNRVGRLRPDFLARCAWDAAIQECTGKESTVKDGRRSFPSGHSSTSFVGMTVIVLLLAGKTGALCFNAPTRPSSVTGSRLARLIITLLPFVWSGYVAITRLEDYRHHKEDVIVGSLIGLLSAYLVYNTFWPSPFSPDSFTGERWGTPRLLYKAPQSPHEYHPANNEDLEVV